MSEHTTVIDVAELDDRESFSTLRSSHQRQIWMQTTHNTDIWYMNSSLKDSKIKWMILGVKKKAIYC